MLFYLFLFLVIFSIQFFPIDTRKKYLWRTVISFVPLFLFGAFRYDCNDYNEYEKFYDFAHDYVFYDEINEHYEYVWAYINYIMPSFRLLVIIQTLIMFACDAWVFYKYIPPRYSWLAFLLLFLAGDKSIYFMSAMRNSIAISLMIASLPLIQSRDWKKYLIVVFVASLFHTTAIVMLMVPFFVGRSTKMSLMERNIWLLVLILLLIVPIDVFVSQILPFVETGTFEKYSLYFEEVHSAGELVKGVSVVMVVLMLTFLCRHSDSSTDSICRVALLFLYFGFMGTLNARGGQFYIVPLVLATTLLYSRCKIPYIRAGFTFLTIVYLAYGLFIVEYNSRYSSFKSFKSLIDFTL